MKEIFLGVFEERRGKRKVLLTQNFTPGKRVYDEEFVRERGIEYREWNPRKSKLAAAILKGADKIGIKSGNVVLYLGASTGTTASHVSDIVGKNGFVFALDFAPRVLRELVFVCEERKNMTPLFFDANHPEEYKDKIINPVDIVYMDISQREQAEIFLKNVEMFLKEKGFCLLAVKARSINVNANPRQIFDIVRKKLEKQVDIIDSRILDPFERDHCMFICRKR